LNPIDLKQIAGINQSAPANRRAFFGIQKQATESHGLKNMEPQITPIYAD